MYVAYSLPWAWPHYLAFYSCDVYTQIGICQKHVYYGRRFWCINLSDHLVAWHAFQRFSWWLSDLMHMQPLTTSGQEVRGLRGTSCKIQALLMSCQQSYSIFCLNCVPEQFSHGDYYNTGGICFDPKFKRYSKIQHIDEMRGETCPIALP